VTLALSAGGGDFDGDRPPAAELDTEARWKKSWTAAASKRRRSWVNWGWREGSFFHPPFLKGFRSKPHKKQKTLSLSCLVVATIFREKHHIIVCGNPKVKHGADATDDRVEQGGGPIIAIIIREAMGDGDDYRRRGGRGTTTLVVVVVVVGGGGGHPPLAAGPRRSP